jgi:hypothetical protein
VRAIGPSLAQYGVTNPILDPALALFDANGTMIASNDNWQDNDAATIQATGLAPSDPRESAIVRTMEVGNYTAIMRGQNQASGTGLVEVYEGPAGVSLTQPNE